MDRLRDLPLSIIETILCLIPIQEAGRTSILSRDWRYRWTKIPKLVFEENTFPVSTVDEAQPSILNKRQKMRKKNRTSKLIYAVGQVLLRHNGLIHEFTLSLLKSYSSAKIDIILTHLSRKTSIKKLKLDFAYAGYKLPSSIFSFRQLTDLCLTGCYFDHQPPFNGFGSLTRLHLKEVSISTRKLQHLVSNCPLLKTVILNICRYSLFWSNDGLNFTELLECLPVIETLSLSFDLIKALEGCVDGIVPRELPTPNLEKLKILDAAASETSWESSPRVDCYPGIMLEHLNELEIRDFVSHKTRLDFVKLILARSPVLKKVRIFPHYNYRDEKLTISEILLGYSRASPEVQIIVEDPWQPILLI